MSGIDSLRTLAGAWDECDLGGALMDVADQIERERACDEDAIENVRLIVGGVIDDMERHVSGVEGADDSPVARWARELRHAMKSDASDECGAQKPSWHDHADAADVTSGAAKVTRDPADDVSMSAYDLLPADEREAIAWVREHGGLERVKAQRRESMPRAAYERKKAGFLGHIAECERALRRRNQRIEELGHRASDLAVDGKPLREGETVWDTNGDELVIGALENGGHTVTCRYVDVGDAIPVHGMWSPSDLTHAKPEIDTWERIEEDAGCTATKYNERRGTIFTTKQQVARDLVRRAKALAERERGK